MSYTCESNDCFQLLRNLNENNSTCLRAQRIVSASVSFCRFWLLSSDQPQQSATIFSENSLKNTLCASKGQVVKTGEHWAAKVDDCCLALTGVATELKLQQTVLYSATFQKHAAIQFHSLRFDVFNCTILGEVKCRFYWFGTWIWKENSGNSLRVVATFSPVKVAQWHLNPRNHRGAGSKMTLICNVCTFLEPECYLQRD